MNTTPELRKRREYCDITENQLEREIDYLRLQEAHCIDRLNFYQSKGDQMKVVLWDELSDYCEDLYLKKLKEAKELRAESLDITNELIIRCQSEIDKILDPWRQHANRYKKSV